MAKKLQFLKPLERRLARPEGPSIPAYIGAVLGGALLGGIALALLNRKTIQELHEKMQQSSAPHDEIY